MPWDNRRPEHRLSKEHHRERGHVLKRDNRRCVVCGSDDRVSVDHIVPRYRGGTDTRENLRTLCHSCHSAKTSSESIEAKQARRDARFRPPPKHPGLI